MLGDMIPILTGAVMAEHMNGRRTVALTWIGDGGTVNERRFTRA